LCNLTVPEMSLSRRRRPSWLSRRVHRATVTAQAPAPQSRSCWPRENGWTWAGGEWDETETTKRKSGKFKVRTNGAISVGSKAVQPGGFPDSTIRASLLLCLTQARTSHSVRLGSGGGTALFSKLVLVFCRNKRQPLPPEEKAPLPVYPQTFKTCLLRQTAAISATRWPCHPLPAAA
jgi:hypothetical protein